MKIISVNLGVERELQTATSLSKTGIYKSPAEGMVQISKTGLKGDVIQSKKHHGGPDQAVYVFGAADYQWWSNELGRKLSPGTFGDNLTISELESADFNIGDRLQMGSVMLEVTAPRIPCATLAARMGDPQFVKKYRDAERPGFYCRVIAEGDVRAGDIVAIQRRQRAEESEREAGVIEIFRYWYEKDKDKSMIRKFLNAPVAIRLRKRLEADLEKILLKKPP